VHVPTLGPDPDANFRPALHTEVEILVKQIKLELLHFHVKFQDSFLRNFTMEIDVRSLNLDQRLFTQAL
jgi:hypothetical protein